MTQTDSALVSGAVIVGVDTHKDVHVAVALDVQGRRLGCCSVPTTSAGLLQLEQWSIRYGTVEVWGVEGTGSYGAGLTRQLVGHGHRVREVSRPERKVRRDKGKSDLIDAELAARSVLAGTDLGAPKETRTTSESLRVLRATRRSAVKARTQAANLLHALLLTAPGELRSRLEHGSLRVRAHRCARLRPTDPANPADATKMALRSVAQRWLQLTAEIRPLESAIERLTQLAAPDLRAQVGVGADVAAALLIAVGGNPDRLVSEASFAALCGVSPIPASSGKTNRHHLNRGGDRQANAALHAVGLARLRRDPTTRAYLTRRTAEGLSKKDIMRCLIGEVSRVRLGRMPGRGFSVVSGDGLVAEPMRRPVLVLPPSTRRGPGPALGTCPTEGRTMRNRRGPRHRGVNHFIPREASDEVCRVRLGQSGARCDGAGRGRPGAGSVGVSAL
jgi:transposase